MSGSQPSFKWAVLTTALAFVMAQLDVSIVNIALPQIASAFGAGISALQWVIDSYTLAFAVLMLSAGSLSDLIGAKRVFQLGMIIFAISSLGCGVAPNVLMLVSFRVLQGFGAAAMIPSSLALLNYRFADEPLVRSRAVSWWTAAGSAALVAGPTIGGLLIELANWRYIFFVNIPVCLVAYLMSVKIPNTPRAGKGKFDIFGQLTWMLSITVLIAAIIEGPKRGFNDPLIICAIAFSIVLFMVFLWLERSVEHPMLPFHLFRSGTFNSLLILGAVLNGCYYGSVFIISLYLQQVLHYSSLSAGFAFLPLTAGFVISNIISARAINKYGIRKPILIGLTIFAAGFAGLFIAGASTPYWQLFLPFLIIPLGMGLAVPAMINGVLTHVDKQLSGTASAILNTSRQTAGAIGVAVFGAMAAGNGAAIMTAVWHSAAISIGLIITVFFLVYRMVR